MSFANKLMIWLTVLTVVLEASQPALHPSFSTIGMWIVMCLMATQIIFSRLQIHEMEKFIKLRG